MKIQLNTVLFSVIAELLFVYVVFKTNNDFQTHFGSSMHVILIMHPQEKEKSVEVVSNRTLPLVNVKKSSIYLQ